MRPDDRSDRIGEGDSIENIGADDGMNLHLLELFRRQAPGLVNDVIGHSQFANIVEKGGGSQGIRFVLAQREFLGDFRGVSSHAMQMLMSRVILGVNGERQAFDGAEVKGADLFDVALFR